MCCGLSEYGGVLCLRPMGAEGCAADVMRDATTRTARARYVPIPPKNHGYRVGRVQRQIQRAFIASNGQPVSTSTLIRWCFPKLKTLPSWHYKSIRVAAARFAKRIGRSETGSGRAYLWVPK